MNAAMRTLAFAIVLTGATSGPSAASAASGSSFGLGVAVTSGEQKAPALSAKLKGKGPSALHSTLTYSGESAGLTADYQREFALTAWSLASLKLYAGLGLAGVASKDGGRSGEAFWLRLPLGTELLLADLNLSLFIEGAREAGPLPTTNGQMTAMCGARAEF